jgi:tRNA-splicing endonuclease subunit Sen34
MIGGIAEFKQQNRVRGLPMQLSPEEVTFLLHDEGVIRLYSMDDFSERVRLARKSVAAARDVYDDSDDSSSSSSSSDDDDDDDPEKAEAKKRTWQYALAHGTEFVIPNECGSGEEARQWDCPWDYPQTEMERWRCRIFTDLKRKKYCITAGSKFGCDYLLYPGDPTLFHAQFCVNVIPIDEPFVMSCLSASCRGSFQARKHLLHASVDAETDRIVYTTFGQLGGFG